MVTRFELKSIACLLEIGNNNQNAQGNQHSIKCLLPQMQNCKQMSECSCLGESGSERQV